MRGWLYIYNIYTNMSSYRHHILAISPAVKIYRAGDNRRTVNTSTTPHISDQLGTENVCKTLLCWFIFMIRILVCNNMYQYQYRFWSFYHNPRRFRFIVGKWVNTGYFFLYTTTGNNSVTDVFLLRQNVKIKCKEYFSYHFPCWPVGVFRSNHVVFKFPLTMHTAGNRGGKTTETERILDSNVWSLYRRIF